MWKTYDVVSVSLTPDGSYGTLNNELLVRTERVDIETNSIFKNCKTQEDVKKHYEGFWALDERWRYGQCKVLAVIPVNREQEIKE